MIRVGIVGLGMAVTPHARSLQELGDRVTVAAAFSPTASRRQSFAANYGLPVVDDLETLLADNSVQAMLVLTPPNTHLDLVRRCADAGKHVLLEKPIEIDTDRAADLVRLCRKAGVKLGMVLQHRYRPSAVALRDILRSNRLGAIVGASAFVRLWRPQSYYDQPGRGTKARDGGGVLLTQAIHSLDLLLDLAGPIVEVTGYGHTSRVHRMETEDMICAAARFASGALGTIDATTAAYPGFPERIEIIAEQATAVIAGTELRLYWQDGRMDVFSGDNTAGGAGADPMAFPHDYHRAVIEGFVSALEEGKDPPITGESALQVHRLIDALLEAAASGRPAAVKPTEPSSRPPTGWR